MDLSCGFASERMAGISYIQNERRFSQFMRDPNVKKSFDSVKDSENELIIEPTARMLAEGKLKDSFSKDDSKKTK